MLGAGAGGGVGEPPTNGGRGDAERDGCRCLVLEQAVGSVSPLRLVAEVMAGREGCPCSVLKQAAGTLNPLRLVAELMAGREGGLCLALEEAAGLVSPL